MFPSIVEDYYKETANDRQVLVQVHEIVEKRFAGIFLGGCEGKSPLDLVQSLIRSIDIVEHEICDPSGDFLKLSRDVRKTHQSLISATKIITLCGWMDVYSLSC